MKDLVKQEGKAEQFDIASAATSTEEIGNGVHWGTRSILGRLGISCAGKTARQIDVYKRQPWHREGAPAESFGGIGAEGEINKLWQN